MISRRSFIILATLASIIPSASVAVPAVYTATALAEAQKLGRPIIIEIFAPWCPTCRVQREVLDEFEQEQRYWQVIRLVVDFDSQTADVRALKATRQGTLIMFKGVIEMGRIVGQTQRDAIEALLNQAL